MYDREGSESVAIRDSILRNGLHVSPSLSSSVVVDECQWERRRSSTTMLVNLDRSLNIEFNLVQLGILNTHTFLFLYYMQNLPNPPLSIIPSSSVAAQYLLVVFGAYYLVFAIRVGLQRCTINSLG